VCRIAQNSGEEKLWQINDFKVLAKKTFGKCSTPASLAGEKLLAGENFDESEGKLSFFNLLKWLVFNDALTHNLKGHVIDNDVHVFSGK